MNQSINKFKSFSFFDRDVGSLTRATSNVEDEEIDKKIEKIWLKVNNYRIKYTKKKGINCSMLDKTLLIKVQT